VLYLLALIFIGGVVWVTLHVLPLIVLRGLDWDDVRSVLLHYAYRSFTFEGDVIPGVRPSLGTRLVILVLSRQDEARRELVAKALAATEQQRRAPSRMGRGSAMSRALVEARWFAAPPLGAQLRARSVAGAGRTW
jgi:hypothetical protein